MHAKCGKIYLRISPELLSTQEHVWPLIMLCLYIANMPRFKTVQTKNKEEMCMYSNKPIIFLEERRKKPDAICMWLEIASIAAWIILFCVLVFYQDAKPQVEIFLDRFFEIEVRETWDNNKLKTAFHLLVFLFLFSTFSIFLNFKRLKRSTDRIRKSFIISLAGSVIGIIIYLSGYLM